MSDAGLRGSDPTEVRLPSDTEIVAVRRFRAARARVYAAFVTPELLERWWGPAGWRTTVDRLEPRAGGAWRIRLTGPGGEEHVRHGSYLEVVPEHRIVRTLAFGEFPGLSVVETVEFEGSGDTTRVTLRTVFPSPVDPNGLTPAVIQSGVRSLLTRLSLLVEASRSSGG